MGGDTPATTTVDESAEEKQKRKEAKRRAREDADRKKEAIANFNAVIDDLTRQCFNQVVVKRNDDSTLAKGYSWPANKKWDGTDVPGGFTAVMVEKKTLSESDLPEEEL